MSVISMTFPARCKHCKFLSKYTPLKKNGEPSRLNRYKCGNPESKRKNISPQEKVCEKWEL